MPIQSLHLEAETENVKQIKRKANTPLILNLVCNKCDEQHNNIELLPENQEDVPNSRGKTQFNCRCKGCKQENTIDVKKECQFSGLEQGQQKMFEIEIRGQLKIKDWKFSAWEIVTLNDFDLTVEDADEVVEWDEKGECNVNVLNVVFTVM